MNEKIVIRNEAPEWHWWTRLPNIVLERVDDPYELALLFVIRKVAGDDADDGVCYMSLRSLAKLAKMGKSTADRKIRSLSKKGLIEAKLKKAPTKSQGWKVWHIRIPRSLWEENERAYCEYPKEKVSQRGTDRQDESQSVPERGESVPEISPTKNHIKKNHISLYRERKGPPSPKRRKRSKKRDPRLDHPACQIYRHFAKKTAKEAARSLLIQTYEQVGEAAFRKGVEEWMVNWSPLNITGLCDRIVKESQGEAGRRVSGRPRESREQEEYYDKLLRSTS